MTNHNIEIKSVKTFTGHEGTGINATVYSNGIKAFFYLDDANGGGGNIEAVYNKEATAEVENFISQQGDVVSDINGEPFSYKYSVDDLINELLISWENEKFQKSLQRKMKKAIVIMDPSKSGEYRYYQFKVNLTDIPVDNLKLHLKNITLKLKKGEAIVNKFNFNF